ncbi:MAG: transcriptional regulator [Burkholderiaceae bacterium]
MEIRPIRTQADYKAMLAEVSKLVDLDPRRDTPEGDRLEVLSLLVEAYEDEHYPMRPPTPVAAIKFHMDNTGMTPADLVPYIGTRARVSEILNGKRPLTMPMIRRLMTLGIPAESLVGQPEPVAA